MNHALFLPGLMVASLVCLGAPTAASPCSVIDTDVLCIDLVDESIVYLGCDDPAGGYQAEYTVLTATAAGETVQAYGQDGCYNDGGYIQSGQSVSVQYQGSFGSVAAGYDHPESPYPACTLRLYYETFVAGHDGYQPVNPLVCEALDLAPWGQFPF